MILAAGLGTRLRPLTNNKPKALVEVQGRPLLEYAILKLKRAGFNEIVINIHHFADQIIDFLEQKNNFGIQIQLSDERQQLLETGGGLLKATPFLQDCEAFLLYNVDIITDLDIKKMYDQHIQSGALATLAVKERETSRQILFDETNHLCTWQNILTGEKKVVRQASGKLTPIAFSGIHVISPKIFDLMSETGKFSIIDTYLRLADKYSIQSYTHNRDLWLDMGNKEKIKEANNLKSIF